MINVRIKTLPPTQPGGEPRAVTTKVFLVKAQLTDEGFARALEPGDVVALDDAQATEALRALPYELEMTHEPPNRPLYYKNADQAFMTSQFFNPNSEGRAEEAKAAMQQALADAQAPEAQAEIERINELEARERAIREREIELGLIEDGKTFEDDLDIELADVPAANNTLTTDELKQEIAELKADGAEIVTDELQRDKVEPEPAAKPTRRRRRA